VVGTTPPILTWSEPVALQKPAPGFGDSVEVVPASAAQALIRGRIVKDLAIDLAVTAGFALLAGGLLVAFKKGSFWYGVATIVLVRAGIQLVLHGARALGWWRDVPMFPSGTVAIYPNAFCYTEPTGATHVWPVDRIRRLRLSIKKHRQGSRRLCSVGLGRANWFHILVPDDVTFAAIDSAAKTAGIPVSWPET
jgi:hypothetical protein